ncbi:MAG: helix-turn-helix domain-containing protein [Bacteroidota bacterium]
MSSYSEIIKILLIAFPLMFALMLFTTGNRGVQSNKILGFFMIITSIQFLFVIDLGSIELINLGYYIAIPLMFANAPLLYYYVVKLTSEKSINNKVFLLHFLPSLIILIINIITYSQLSDEIKLLILNQQPLTSISASDTYLFNIYKTVYQISSLYIYNIQVIIYGILMLMRYFRHRKTIKLYFSYTEKISLQWILLFILIFWGITAYELFLYDLYRDFYHYILFAYIGFVGYFGFKQHDIYVQEIIEDSNNKTKIIIEERSVEVKELESINNDPSPILNTNEKTERISSKQVNEYVSRLEAIMITDKPHLNSNLNISELAEILGVHRNTLSMIINDFYHKNFFLFINEYRIEEAKKKLIDHNFDNLSIEGIAKSVGFNSKSVFNPAFKNITGVTPAEYKKQYSL